MNKRTNPIAKTNPSPIAIWVGVSVVWAWLNRSWTVSLIAVIPLILWKDNIQHKLFAEKTRHPAFGCMKGLYTLLSRVSVFAFTRSIGTRLSLIMRSLIRPERWGYLRRLSCVRYLFVCISHLDQAMLVVGRPQQLNPNRDAIVG